MRSDLITDKLPPEEYWPSPDDLRKAEDCLKSGSPECQLNLFLAQYYCTLSDWHIWKHQYSEATPYLEKARELYEHVKPRRNIELHRANQRLMLIINLKEEKKIDEILTKTDIV